MRKGVSARQAIEPAAVLVPRNFRINLGDIIIHANDIFGDGVNIAARLEALAEPSGVCISRVVREQIRDKLPYAFEDMGEQSVKNITRPLRAYAMNVAGAVIRLLVLVLVPVRLRILASLKSPTTEVTTLSGNCVWTAFPA